MLEPSNKQEEKWIAPNQAKLPSFIIGGAMKSGTTTIHRILAQHRKVFIPKKEIGFFDIDSILDHYDYNFYEKGKWTSQSMEQNSETLWKWYNAKFNDANNSQQVKGEHSTTYLYSRIAAKRIAFQHKEIKLIFLLRNPTARAYSNYLHLLRRGQAVYNFENTLRYNAHSVLYKSLYLKYLEPYFEMIPNDRIKIVLFEDFVDGKEKVLQEICAFLNLNFSELPKSAFKEHSNKGKVPRSETLQLLRNRLLRSESIKGYKSYLPFVPRNKNQPSGVKAFANKLHSKLNPMVDVTNRPIKKETKDFLDAYFKIQLEGLDELIGRDLLSAWFK